ncbi:MAG: succinate dehydrogenase [Amylibacter sp.]|nr:succinate dehydrogenase [Amylibacter sp.]|tara:strand:+ start:816 stop:929 length:114 start_codon:yes stop_codon:yes gene_type:complete
MNILKITAIIAVALTLTACDQAVQQGTVTKDVASSKL